MEEGMPKFSELARIRDDGILRWQDIARLTGAEHDAAVAAAAKGLWYIMTTNHYGEMEPAYLLWDAAHPKQTITEEIIPGVTTEGFSWEGAFNAVFRELWPDMPAKASDPVDETPEGIVANNVRRQVGSYLKRSRNIVNIVHGGYRFHLGGHKQSVWFVAA